MNRAWGFDVSHWDVQFEGGPIIDYAPLIQLEPSFVFVKVSDGVSLTPRHPDHIAAVRKAGLVLGLYHFKGDQVLVYEIVDTWGRIDPTQSLWVNVKYLRKA